MVTVTGPCSPRHLSRNQMTAEMTIHWRVSEGPPRVAKCGATGDIALLGFYRREWGWEPPGMVNCPDCKAPDQHSSEQK